MGKFNSKHRQRSLAAMQDFFVERLSASFALSVLPGRSAPLTPREPTYPFICFEWNAPSARETPLSVLLSIGPSSRFNMRFCLQLERQRSES